MSSKIAPALPLATTAKPSSASIAASVANANSSASVTLSSSSGGYQQLLEVAASLQALGLPGADPAAASAELAKEAALVKQALAESLGEADSPALQQISRQLAQLQDTADEQTKAQASLGADNSNILHNSQLIFVDQVALTELQGASGDNSAQISQVQAQITSLQTQNASLQADADKQTAAIASASAQATALTSSIASELAKVTQSPSAGDPLSRLTDFIEKAEGAGNRLEVAELNVSEQRNLFENDLSQTQAVGGGDAGDEITQPDQVVDSGDGPLSATATGAVDASGQAAAPSDATQTAALGLAGRVGAALAALQDLVGAASLNEPVAQQTLSGAA